MNLHNIIIECIAGCLLFSLVILPPLYKNPLSQIISYPTAIRKRVEQLPQYADIVSSINRRRIAIKIIGIFFLALLFVPLTYFSGDATFFSAFLHIFIIAFAINIYDLVILDICIFCHSKKLMIPGTEDMTEEYRNPMHHIRGAGLGTAISIIIAALTAGLTVLARLLFG